MYSNIGGKIKSLAISTALLGALGSIIVGIGMMASDNTFLAMWGICVIAFGIFSSWISSFKLYGFGELIENSEAIKLSLSSESASTVDNTQDNGWYCRKCGIKNRSSANFCTGCGQHR